MKTFEAKMTAEGQITVPAPVRAALRLKPGDTLMFDQDDAGRFCMHVGGETSHAIRPAEHEPERPSEIPTDLALLPWIAGAARRRLEPISDGDDPIGDYLVAEDARTKSGR